MQKAQREEAPGVPEPRGSLCCVYKRLDKGPGQGRGWHHPGHCVRCWLFIERAATCLCLHLQWKWWHHSYFQLCVCLPVLTAEQGSSQPHFRKSGWLWFKPVNGSEHVSIPRGRNWFFLFCASSDMCVLPFFVCLGLVWLIAFWRTEIWSGGSSWFPVCSGWIQGVGSVLRGGRFPEEEALTPMSCTGWCPGSYLN